MSDTNNDVLKIGDKIPEILGTDQNNKTLKASDFKGKNLIIYFYPKDNTPGCTAEACSFRDNLDELNNNNYQVIGVSADTAESHRKFIDKQKLTFPLIADTDKQLINKFGVWGEKKFMGKTYMGILRTTFMIDKDGIITDIITPKEIKTKIHGEQIINKLNKHENN